MDKRPKLNLHTTGNKASYLTNLKLVIKVEGGRPEQGADRWDAN